MKIDPETLETLNPWFKETSFADISLVHEGPFAWIVRNVLHQGALTFPPFIFYGRSRFDPTSLSSVALLAHELHHVEQYRRMGHLRFLATYLRDKAKNGFRYSYDLPLEAECYALQAKVTTALRGRFPTHPA